MTFDASLSWMAPAIAGAAGVLAGVPLAALVFAVPVEGRIRVSSQWWLGRPAPLRAVIVLPALTGTAAAIACSQRVPVAAIPAFWLVAVLGVGLGAIDIRRRRLPHALTGVLWVTCGVCFAAEAAINGDGGHLAAAVVCGAVTGIALLLVALALPGQLGLGDVNFASVLALSLGWLRWSAVPAGLLAAFGFQAAIAVSLRVVRGRSVAALDGVPMGPSLIIGWLLVLVCGVTA